MVTSFFQFFFQQTAPDNMLQAMVEALNRDIYKTIRDQ